MIPTPVIRHFLKDVEDGRYDRYMDLSIGTFPLLNPAHRRALGLADDDRGVVVSSVQSAGVCAGVLEAGDVVLSVDGHAVASDGMVEIDGERVQMAEIVERKFLGDFVRIGILRGGKAKEVQVVFDRAWPHGMQATSYEAQPRYVLFGGLLFQPLNRNLLGAYQFHSPRISYYFDSFVSQEVYKRHPEIVVLSGILPDPINTFLGEFREGIVDEINGRKVETLKDVAEGFAGESEYYVVKFVGLGRPLVLERSVVLAARERIRSRYNVGEEQVLTGVEKKPVAHTN
jgi:hypothetical protein